VTIALLISAVVAAAPVRALPELATVAERSQWQRTGRYDEVLRLCADYPRVYPGRVRCEKFGVTPEGRPMVALVVGNKGPTLLAQGGIHAGEIDGKDAGFWFLRELLDGKLLDRKTLAGLRFVFVPVFNVDGHERFGPHHRPNQIGPEESGWRVTAQNLNLNRDYVKAQAPEMRAMLALLDKYDPIVYADLHVTDGSNFQHDVAVLVDPANAQLGAPAELTKAAAGLRDAVIASLTAQHHLPLGEFYPAFLREDDPAAGVALQPTSPRFSDGYWATRNRIGVLVETHSWKDYATRVRATHDVLTAIAHELAQHGAGWQEAARAAEREPLAGVTLPLSLEADLHKSRVVDFLGYAYQRIKSPLSGQMRIIYDPSKPEVWKLPYFDTLVPTESVTLPRAGWLVPSAWVDVVRPLLEAHGVQFRALPAATLDVEAFRAVEVKAREATFEGRATVRVKGAWQPERRSFPGGIFIPIAQPRARIAVQLLEPEAPDSFTSWGFFNAVFERKEYMEDYVLEGVAEGMLSDPKLKAEFEQRLASDEKFAKSPRARLDFFYRRDPAWDERYNLVPVFRLQKTP
jgi:hypothetical protein